MTIEARGRYSDAVQAAAMFRRYHGDADLIAVAGRLLGEPLSSPLSAGRGDLLAFRRAADLYFGVCVGPFGVAVGRRGLVRAPSASAVAAWRI